MVEDLCVLGQADEEIFKNCVAVVGSRQMTGYGQAATRQLVAELVGEGVTVVSGGMHGIDMEAHRAVLKLGGRTVVVLGMGLDQGVARLGRDFVDEVIKNRGLIVSKWQSQPATRWTFPARNQIVARLCTRVYVVEAGMESGSLITVGFARKLGREVWAVPGPVTSKASQATNWLIATGQAKMWLPSAGGGRPKMASRADGLAKWLENEALEADEIVRLSGWDAKQVAAELVRLQLEGVIEVRAGRYYYLKDAG